MQGSCKMKVIQMINSEKWNAHNVGGIFPLIFSFGDYHIVELQDEVGIYNDDAERITGDYFIIEKCNAREL